MREERFKSIFYQSQGQDISGLAHYTGGVQLDSKPGPGKETRLSLSSLPPLHLGVH